MAGDEARTRWGPGWRDEVWRGLDRAWDLIVVGGGITGAGIAREAARIGLRVLLLEGHDFAWGTSSRSSKMVHGGLRYLANLQFATTIRSIRERDRLLAGASGLVEPLDFVFADFAEGRREALMVRAGLWVYDRIARSRSTFRLGPAGMRAAFPGIRHEGLRGGIGYRDAETDDARLVLRVLREAARAGATILNYAEVVDLVRADSGHVRGVVVRDRAGLGEREARATARAVINAAGVWVDRLRGRLDRAPRMRPLRGSHLVFPASKVPVQRVLLFPHPVDRRGIYLYPWEGVTLCGTTDLDHRGDLTEEPRITADEVAYLMAAVEFIYPGVAPGADVGPAGAGSGPPGITRDDVISTFAGIRPVIADEHSDPSKASREHAIWREEGLWTITGGKLTTFRASAFDVLRALRRDLPEIPRLRARQPIFDPLSVDHGESLARALGEHATPARALRLLGRHGADASALAERARARGGEHELTPIGETPTLWAELRWAAHAEGVVHLDDLLLRRARIGNLLPEGAAGLLPEIRTIAQPELGWDDAKWEAEVLRYQAIWSERYSVPDP